MSLAQVKYHWYLHLYNLFLYLYLCLYLDLFKEICCMELTLCDYESRWSNLGKVVFSPYNARGSGPQGRQSGMEDPKQTGIPQGKAKICVSSLGYYPGWWKYSAQVELFVTELQTHCWPRNHRSWGRIRGRWRICRLSCCFTTMRWISNLCELQNGHYFHSSLQI